MSPAYMMLSDILLVFYNKYGNILLHENYYIKLLETLLI